jgi:hypothetical protein
VQGANTANGTLATQKLITKSGGAGAWDAGISSVETFAGDGFVEWVIPSTLSAWVVGLSDTDVDVNFTSIDYAHR